MFNRAYVLVTLTVAAFGMCSCATKTNGDAAEISRIEAKCGVKKGTLSLDAKTGFKFNPDPDEKYENVDCALAEIKSSSLARHMKYGFVGNESPAKDEEK